MHTGRIHAVDHVHLEAPPGVEEALRWFYGELVGLTDLPPASALRATVRFKSAQIELRIRVDAEPKIEAVDGRVTFAVSSLVDVEEALRERKIPYEMFRGLDWTDRRISLLDPAGNRVTLRREWPSMAF